MASNQSVYSYGAYASGDKHPFATRWADPSHGVSLHPFQRAGMVSSRSHAMGLGRQRASAPVGIGDGPPAAYANLSMPPVVAPLAGSSAQTRFTV